MILLPTKYIFQLTGISCIILCCFFLFQLSLGSAEIDNRSASKLLESNVATFLKKPIKLNSLLTGGNNIIVFYHNYSCKNCFEKIAVEIEQLKAADKDINLLVLVRASISNKQRRELYKEAKKLLKTDNIYFDIHNKEDKWPPLNLKEGIFGMFPIVQTPAILKISEGKSKIEFKSYADLFQNKDPKKSILELP